MVKNQASEPLRFPERTLEPSKFSLELIRLAYSQETTSAQFLNLIKENNRFSLYLLGYVNSCLSVPSDPISSIPQAVTKLGAETVANISLFCSLLAQYRQGKCQQFDYQRFWQKSLAVGTAAKALAARQSADPDKLFSYGILSRIGELALATAHPTDYGKLLSEGLTLHKREQEEKRRFELSSSELSWELLAKWKIPIQCTEEEGEYKVEFGDLKFNGNSTEICNILNLSALIARICLLELPLSDIFILAEREAENQQIPVDHFGPFFDKLVDAWQASSELFKIPSVHCPNYHQIKTIDDVAMEINHSKHPPLTFLIADDDPITLIFLKTMLAKKNRVLLTAENGNRALELALEHHPNILITDWRMPGMNGIDLCKILRKTKVTQHMYIIMLTGRETEDELVQAFEAGANDYVVKPFTPKVFQARISSGERLILQQQTIHRDRETIQRYAARLATANRKLQNMAMTDFLTCLPNRRSALLRLKNLVAEVKRYGEPLSCLMIDIDHFKKINDTYGHDCGDTVLKQLSTLLEEKARSYDTVSRWGGEEFLIICARSGPNDSFQLAERLRKHVEQYRIYPSDGVEIKATISIGVATWSPAMQNEDELIKEADTCLYLAKKNGRNRVESLSGNNTHSLPQ